MSRPPDAEQGSFIHATAVVIGEIGLLLCGASGSGKSSLALLLIAEAERRGRFGRLVGDDRVSVRAVNGFAVVRPHRTVAGLIECRTLGLVPLRHEAGCVARLVVELRAAPDEIPRLPDEPDGVLLACGLRLPRLRLLAPLGAMSCHLVLQKLSEL